jgi:hypothetical protein
MRMMPCHWLATVLCQGPCRHNAVVNALFCQWTYCTRDCCRCYTRAHKANEKSLEMNQVDSCNGLIVMGIHLLSWLTNRLGGMPMAPGAGHQCQLQSTCITGIHHYQLVTITILIQYIQKPATVMECNCGSIQSGCRVSCCLVWRFVLTHLSLWSTTCLHCLNG